MHYFRVMRRAIACVGVGGVAIGVTLICVWPHEHPLSVVQTAQDNNGRCFQFAKITRGTNHVVYVGGMLAVLRRALCLAHLNPIVNLLPRTLPGTWHEKSSSTNATVLWVGWTRTNYSYTMQGGIPQPDHMDCLAFEALYGDTQLERFYASEAPFTAQMTEAWELPVGVTNGCKIRLVLLGSRKEIGTLTLRGLNLSF